MATNRWSPGKAPIMPKRIRGLTKALQAAGLTKDNYAYGIEWYMGRIHVGTSALTVARDFWHRATKANFPRPVKRAVVRAALRCHDENRTLYARVMGGRF